MRVVEISNQHPHLKIDEDAIRAVIHTLDNAAERFMHGAPDGELSLVFMDDAGIAKLHADFLNDPSVTDVITFEGDVMFGTAGEICVSADTAKTYSAQHGHDFSTELTLYIIHGWLHLAGYDDLEPTKKRRMRAAEKRALLILQQNGSLPTCSMM
ncbi:MAG: hypothetical protein SynsKO_41100 [Synoicihabitans sp.]